MCVRDGRFCVIVRRCARAAGCWAHRRSGAHAPSSARRRPWEASTAVLVVSARRAAGIAGRPGARACGPARIRVWALLGGELAHFVEGVRHKKVGGRSVGICCKCAAVFASAFHARALLEAVRPAVPAGMRGSGKTAAAVLAPQLAAGRGDAASLCAGAAGGAAGACSQAHRSAPASRPAHAFQACLERGVCRPGQPAWSEGQQSRRCGRVYSHCAVHSVHKQRRAPEL